ncbi:tRNA pseudouridine(55) synthase TruB [Candidatus Aquarickettsia rohweri]|uniref:tRNA pseudouridine synthase B n=1 Tax=Candidatus Aquarickettsia rohweri TaxID=2602574 RepID=A0A429XSU3_9RICK|nr:tRNA pseudouridine(55) synthase TruB [Candidatus Aquarickettsia rohweri]RST70082.1 tRNA pseudouridine(55) synthase TruB [Candidatus Aquarickettsia rohweri]
MNGWLLIDKPIGVTSFQTINKFKKLLSVKVGHCGTLDPFASGFLLVALGKATRLVEYAMNFEKNYTFSVKWCISTDSGDLTGNIIEKCDLIPTKNQILDKLVDFIGEIDQVPPVYSAVKVNGKRAYEYARKGEKIFLKSRKVHLKRFKLVSHEGDVSKFNITTSKGFYVRSLAVDFAKSLNTLANVIMLRRNLSDIFQNLKMIENEKIKDFLHKDQLYDYIEPRILPLDYVLDDIPVCNLDEGEVIKLKNGVAVFYNLSLKDNSKIVVKFDDDLVALCVYRDNYIKPLKVF